MEAKRRELDWETDKVREELKRKQQMVEDRANVERKKAGEAATKDAEKVKKELGKELKKPLP